MTHKHFISNTDDSNHICHDCVTKKLQIGGTEPNVWHDISLFNDNIYDSFDQVIFITNERFCFIETKIAKARIMDRKKKYLIPKVD